MEIEITIKYSYDFDGEFVFAVEIKRLQDLAPDFFGSDDVEIEHEEWAE